MTVTGKSRIYPAIIAALLFVIAAMAFKFIISGSTEEAEDGRVAIVLAPQEQALVLHEMREFVAGLQLMSDALSRDDMQAVARVARAMGTAKAHDVPIALMGKLPLAFKTLALGVHRGFDTIAMDAADLGMPRHSLAQVSDVLQKCVACHSGFQLKAAAPR